MNFGTLMGLVVLLICFYILWQMRQLLLLLFTAVILATYLNILVKKCQSYGMKRSYAVLFSVTFLFSLIIGVAWLIVPPFLSQFHKLAQLVTEGRQKFILLLDIVKTELSPEWQSWLDIDSLSEQLQPLINDFLGKGFNLFYNSLAVLLSLLLLLALTLMLLADPVAYRQGFIRLFPSFYRARVREILGLCQEYLQIWLKGIFFNMLAMSCLSFIGLLILGIPLALTQAILTGLLSFIPNVGLGLSAISPMAIALLENPWQAIAVLVLYVVIQQIESQILIRLVIVKQLSYLPGLILLIQILFGNFLGFLGLILAMPLTVVGQVWIKEVIIKDILDKWVKT